MPFFSKVFKGRDSASKKNAKLLANGADAPEKPQWSDAWLRTRVDPEEVVELLKGCTAELKSRGLDMPFLLLPFRPTSDPSAARTFVRNYFFPQTDREEMRGGTLTRELRLTEPMVLASVMKWCWSRLPGGVVTWEGYELFKVGERDSRYARDAFKTFIPMSVNSDARVQIIRDFFDLLAAIAAHGKTNGFGGRKLSRFAGWWAFEHYDTGKGFDAGYRSWASAADATSHLFFAYLRSMSPESPRGANGILGLPISLQQLVESTEYPPEPPTLMFHQATKVVMIVDVVSPTPFALLRRAKNFEYRDEDAALQQFSNYNDPIRALTDECRRVLKCISSTNQSTAVSNSKTSTSLLDPSWSRFEDIGFGGTIEESDDEDTSMLGPKRGSAQALSKSSRTQTTDFGRPTTPSWADFLSSGFIDENGNRAPAPILLPPDKALPRISTGPRGQSSQSHRRQLETESTLEPGELASIDRLDLDDSFWWVWISSLAGEEPTSRKAAFGRCALIETILSRGKWMVMEEQVKGAAPEPTPGAYIAEKKGFLGFTTKRGRLTRRRSAVKKEPKISAPYQKPTYDPLSHVTVAPDQQARIQAAAAELSRKKDLEKVPEERPSAARQNRLEADARSHTNSMLSLQPFIITEASPAMKWANQYDKKAVRAQYLGDTLAGKGSSEMLTLPTNGFHTNGSASSFSKERDLPAPPPKDHPVVEKVQGPIRISPPPQVRAPSPAVARMPSPPAPISAPPPPPVDPVRTVELRDTMHAAEVRLPDPEPTPVPEPVIEALAPQPDTPPSRPQSKQSKLRKKSVDISPEQRRGMSSELSRQKPRGPPKAGLRLFFGTKRSRSRDGSQPKSPVDPNPAIAAARAALEGKTSPRETNNLTLPPAQQNGGRFSKLRSKQLASEPRSNSPPTNRPPTPPRSTSPTVETNVGAAAHDVPHGPPRTHRDDEYDNLSRVSTHEREHADREFSMFDQTGPPAFVPRGSLAPAESPAPEAFSTPRAEEPPSANLAGGRNHAGHFSVYSAVTAHTLDTNADEEPERVATKFPEAEPEQEPELTKQISPGDRWAQIRKNAAERAARQDEDLDQGGFGGTPGSLGGPTSGHGRGLSAGYGSVGTSADGRAVTDDGETSGEETIESRVARIKARVAELTGNMESARR